MTAMRNCALNIRIAASQNSTETSQTFSNTQRCSAWNSVTFQSQDVPSPTNLQAAEEITEIHTADWGVTFTPSKTILQSNKKYRSVGSLNKFSDKQKQSGSLDLRGDDFWNKSTALIRSPAPCANTKPRGGSPGSALSLLPSPRADKSREESPGGIYL